MHTLSLFSEDYLLNHHADAYRKYRDDRKDDEVLARLRWWSGRDATLTETQLESALLNVFFRDIWGYEGSGERPSNRYTLSPKHPIAAAGAAGGVGIADVALGHFGDPADPDDPCYRGVVQVVGEFKDIRSGLDTPQRRNGISRSPARQLLDYLRAAEAQTDTREPVRPSWGILTDMNEFRLYHRTLGLSQYQRFVVSKLDGDAGPTLLDDNEVGAVQRFLFSLVFHTDTLLSFHGTSTLQQLLDKQWVKERDLEADFYRHYARFRDHLFTAIIEANPALAHIVALRLTQRLLDRFIFTLFCEDMGERLRFPDDLVRDILVRASLDPHFDEHGTDLWARMRQLFETMETGGMFGKDKIPGFGGGLFASTAAFEQLAVPNHVFCARNQGASCAALDATTHTLLYLSATYNFGECGAPRRRTIGLHTLGRIFEQSITDLEIMEAKASGRPSSVPLSKRKRDGVYYTPEVVTGYVVEETIGCKLLDIKAAIQLPDASSITDQDIAKWREHRRKTGRVATYLRRLAKYGERVENLTVLDFACGSGAFLIQALGRLIEERRWISAEHERITQERKLFDHDAHVRSMLSRNIYGVDVNPESVEITKLALWLHTARADQPLTSLDRNIRVGNSLMDEAFIASLDGSTQTSLFTGADDEREDNVRVFCWTTAFPEVFARGGFDCIIGNPPYVKYQNLRKAEPIIARYLRAAYVTAARGNFDLYVPFIEKGLSLLAEHGRMGLIAPSLWTKLEYGADLRRLIHQRRALERWLEFGNAQIFKDATTYTALQFYTKTGNDVIRYVRRPCGRVNDIDWDGPDVSRRAYAELSDSEPWVFVDADVLGLISRLQAAHPRLREVVASISVGVQTSADRIFHVEQASDGHWGEAFVRPLVSGTDVEAFARPMTARHIIFPYQTIGDETVLVGADELCRRAPSVWRHLERHEAALRGRERGGFDDDQWYRFGRSQNIDKQHLAKLLIPRLVKRLAAAPDPDGAFVADNVDVSFVVPRSPDDLWYLLGVLNSSVANFIVVHTSKPFRGGYVSANKQYIAPLPIPAANVQDRGRVIELAQVLYRICSRRVRLRAELQACLASPQLLRLEHEPHWLWNSIPTLERAMFDVSPSVRGVVNRRKAARGVIDELVRQHVALWTTLDERPLSVVVHAGELRICNADAAVVQGNIYVDEQPQFVAAQWRMRLQGRCVGPRELLKVLLSYCTTSNQALRERVIAVDRELAEATATIQATERELDAVVCGVYGLTADELELVRRGPRPA